MSRRIPKLKLISEKWKVMAWAVLPLLLASVAGWYWHQDAEAMLESKMIAAREATESGLVETDVKGVIINANSHMFDLTGYTRDELIGRDLKSIMVQQARSKHPERMDKIERAMTIVRCKLLTKEGKENSVVVMARIANGKYIASIIKEELVIDHFSRPINPP